MYTEIAIEYGSHKCALDTFFLSNQIVLKISFSLCFWAPDLLFEFYFEKVCNFDPIEKALIV